MGLNVGSAHILASSIPESVYCMYQLVFAIITCALICGSFADRMKFGPMLIFMILWHVGVYCPIAHWNWHQDGFLFKAGNMDFAGGNVVHISSGVAGLMSTIVVGNRKGFGKERFEPHNILLTFFGASLLWVGWYGFNAGSAGAAGILAGIAMLNTQLATATAALTWLFTEWSIRKQPSVLGILSGAVAGLVAITPACGYVDPTGAFFIGFIAGPVCYFGAQLKKSLGFDDALDAFGVHAIGGITGGILTGFFATDEYNGFKEDLVAPQSAVYPLPPKELGIFYGGGGKQLGFQIYGIVCCIAWSAVVSYGILQLLDKTIGLRVTAEQEEEGLDSSLHGETIVGKEEHA
jgi:Amt family ammonium transporter